MEHSEMDFWRIFLLLWSNCAWIKGLNTSHPNLSNASVRYFDYPEEIICAPSGVMVRIRNDSFQGMFLKLSIVDNYGIPRDLHSLPSHCHYTTRPQADGSLLFSTSYKGCYVHRINNTISLELRIDGVDESKRIMVIERIPVSCTLPSLAAVTVAPTKGSTPLDRDQASTTLATVPVDWEPANATVPVDQVPASTTLASVPVDQVPANATVPVDWVPASTTLASVPVDQVPANATVPVDRVPASTTLASVPVDQVPASTTLASVPVDRVPASTTPANATVPVDQVPASTTPANATVPVDWVPASTTLALVPVDWVPASTTLASVPVDQVPASTTLASVPVDWVPASTMLSTVAVDQVPASTTLANATVPVDWEPANATVPVDQVPASTTLATVSVDQVPASTMLASIPVDQVPANATVPVDWEPANATIAVDQKPASTMLATVPVDQKPASITVSMILVDQVPVNATVATHPVDWEPASTTQATVPVDQVPANATVPVDQKPASTILATVPVDRVPVNATVPVDWEPASTKLTTPQVDQVPVNATVMVDQVSASTTLATVPVDWVPVNVTVATHPVDWEPASMTLSTVPVDQVPVNVTIAVDQVSANATVPVDRKPASATPASITMDLKPIGDKTQICSVDAKYHVPCGNATLGELACNAKGCCYDPADKRAPCFYGKTTYIDCTTNGLFTIVIPRIATVPPLDLGSVFLLDNSSQCVPVVRTTEFVIFHFPLNSCGATEMIDGSNITYKVDVMARRKTQSGPRGHITRESTSKLQVICHLTGITDLPLMLVVNTPSPPPFIVMDGVLRIEMRIAKDESYSTWFVDKDYPLVRVLREPVYVEVHLLHRADNSIALVLNNCWATQTLDPEHGRKWPLIVNGCPYYRDNYLTQLHTIDATSNLLFPTHHKRFEVKTFTFWSQHIPTLHGEVYFHCSAAVCLISEMEKCTTTCDAGKRIGRSLDFNTSTEALPKTHQGLVTLKRPILFTLSEGKVAKSSLKGNMAGVLLAAAVTSLALAVICGLVLYWNCKQMHMS